MPMICLEISQFGDSPHAMMNQFQHGVTISILQFWSTLCCYLNKTVSAVGLTNTMTTILLLASFARISTPWKDSKMTLTWLLPRRLPCFCPPLLRLVGLQGRGGNDDANIDLWGDNNDDTTISLVTGWGGLWSGRRQRRQQGQHDKPPPTDCGTMMMDNGSNHGGSWDCGKARMMDVVVADGRSEDNDP